MKKGRGFIAVTWEFIAIPFIIAVICGSGVTTHNFLSIVLNMRGPHVHRANYDVTVMI